MNGDSRVAERQGDDCDNVKGNREAFLMTPAFVASRRGAPRVSSVIDDITTNQSQNNGSTVLFWEAGNVIDSEPMVDKQVANSQSPFGRRVESCAVRRQSKRTLTYLKTLTSVRVACPSEFKKPRSHCDCRKRAGRRLSMLDSRSLIGTLTTLR